MDDADDDGENPWIVLRDIDDGVGIGGNDSETDNNYYDDLDDDASLCVNVESASLPAVDIVHDANAEQQPWLSRDRQYATCRRQRLHEEVTDLYEYLRPTSLESRVRWWLLGRLRRAVHEFWGAPTTVSSSSSAPAWADAGPFGSFTSGVYLPDADIDVVIMTNRPEAPLRLLQQLRVMLHKRGFVGSKGGARLIKARVPIIKFCDRLTHIKVDISVNIESGRQSGTIVENLLANSVWGQAMRVLVLVVKHFLAERGLNEPFTGGLGSYSLSLMVAHFLQTHPLLRHPAEAEASSACAGNVGLLLVEFFEYFGLRFDYARHSIEINSDLGVVPRRCSATTAPPTSIRLSIVDPQQSGHDVAANSFRMAEVVEAFREAYAAMMIVMRPGSSGAIVPAIISVPQRMNCVRRHLSASQLVHHWLCKANAYELVQMAMQPLHSLGSPSESAAPNQSIKQVSHNMGKPKKSKGKRKNKSHPVEEPHSARRRNSDDFPRGRAKYSVV